MVNSDSGGDLLPGLSGSSILVGLLFPLTYVLGEIFVGVYVPPAYPLPAWYMVTGLALALVISSAALLLRAGLHRFVRERSNGIMILIAVFVLALKLGQWTRVDHWVSYVLVLSPLVVLCVLTFRSSSAVRWEAVSVALVAVSILLSTDLIQILGSMSVRSSATGLEVGIAWGLGVFLFAAGVDRAAVVIGTRMGLLGTAGLAGATVVVAFLWHGTREPIPWHHQNGYRGPPLSVSDRVQNSDPAFPNIILISIDTLRWYSTPPRVKALPNLRRLRQDSLVFRKAFSPASWTLPAHASLFTGHLPACHRAVYGSGTPIDPGVPSFTQYLNEMGYSTGGFTDGGPVSGDLGFARGFDRYEHQVTDLYDEFVPGSLELLSWLLSNTRYRFQFEVLPPDPARTRHRALLFPNDDRLRYFSRNLSRARSWLQDVQFTERPWFLFLHTFQLHDYASLYPDSVEKLRRNHPRLWRSLIDLRQDFRRSPPSRTRRESLLELEKKIARFPRLKGFRRVRSWLKRMDFSGPKKVLIQKLLQTEPIHWRALSTLYRYNLNAVDSTLGEFIGYLKRNDIYESSAIILTSDHGEGFALESQAIRHNNQIDEVLIRIPLWIKLPRGRLSNLTIETVTSLREVFSLLGKHTDLPERPWPRGSGDTEFAACSEAFRDTGFVYGSNRSFTKEGPLVYVRDDQYKLAARTYDDKMTFFRGEDSSPREWTIPVEQVPARSRRALTKQMGKLIEVLEEQKTYTPGRIRSGKMEKLQKELRGMGYF